MSLGISWSDGQLQGACAGEGEGGLCLALHRPREDQRGQKVVEQGSSRTGMGGG